ncbi:lipase [Rhodomicrobium udaipurense JA643]|uniref:Alpha/beta hydrolase n=1 Tax=Rhodomicrobium udaipurense TaxID=1202716 RepID=A0A8I1KHK2_9HYPH|nr:alpha/beta hydrolase [Rhodomicrobium udaipurense]KAI93880.1 lipase [Rhodomicrobium udaipurense JA643]MBJ7543805.1 alpha/beta hydrolase [Rhodomicrobium udaipurense]
MTFDSDTEKLLDNLRRAKPLATQDVEEARAAYREKCQRLGGDAPAMSEVKDYQAIGRGGPLRVRLYRPEGVVSPGPALVYLHGGGGVIGDLESHDRICRRIAALTPCRVLAVDYRLAPEHPFPAGLEDAIAAIGWAAANARLLGLDPARLSIGGDSAGGALAAAVCLDARERGPKIASQVLVYPSTDSTQQVKLWPSRRAFADMPPIDRDALRWFSSKYMPQGAAIDRCDERLSPLYAHSLRRLPPALVLTAENDPLHDEGAAYADRLRCSRVATDYRDFAGQIHGFIEYGGVLPSAREAASAVATWLRARS